MGDEHDHLHGVPAIAAAFGWTEGQVNSWKRREGLPTFKIGRKVCASRAAVAKWLADRAARGAQATR